MVIARIPQEKAMDSSAPFLERYAHRIHRTSRSGPAELDALFHHIRRRILPILLPLYFVAYLDRVNLGFAANAMQRDFGGFAGPAVLGHLQQHFGTYTTGLLLAAAGLLLSAGLTAVSSRKTY